MISDASHRICVVGVRDCLACPRQTATAKMSACAVQSFHSISTQMALARHVQLKLIISDNTIHVAMLMYTRFNLCEWIINNYYLWNTFLLSFFEILETNVYTYRRFRWASPACPILWNQEIDFILDFDSFVQAGEAKLCVRVRDMPP